MCDNCENQELQVQETEIAQEELLDDRIVELTLEKEYDRLSRRFILEDEEVAVLASTDEFMEGQKEALKLCGMFSTLLSFGFEEDKAFELIINQQTINHNILNSKITSDMNIAMSKNQVVNFEKNQL